MPSIPSWLRCDPEWDAVATILDTFGSDERVWKHIQLFRWDEDGQSDIDFHAMLVQETFSPTEALLLLTAASLWEGGRFTRHLDDEVESLDDATFRLVLRAIAASCRAPQRWRPNRTWTLRLGSEAKEAHS
jgi:hypothetical protein